MLAFKYGHIGRVYVGMGDYDTAIDYENKAYDIFNEVSLCFSMMSFIKFSLKKWEPNFDLEALIEGWILKSFFLICIEANNRIGGRCYTDNDFFGVPYDMGAHWITNNKNNPYVHYWKENNI